MTDPNRSEKFVLNLTAGELDMLQRGITVLEGRTPGSTIRALLDNLAENDGWDQVAGETIPDDVIVAANQDWVRVTDKIFNAGVEIWRRQSPKN